MLVFNKFEVFIFSSMIAILGHLSQLSKPWQIMFFIYQHEFLLLSPVPDPLKIHKMIFSASSFVLIFHLSELKKPSRLIMLSVINGCSHFSFHFSQETFKIQELLFIRNFFSLSRFARVFSFFRVLRWVFNQFCVILWIFFSCLFFFHI